MCKLIIMFLIFISYVLVEVDNMWVIWTLMSIIFNIFEITFYIKGKEKKKKKKLVWKFAEL